MNDKVKQLPMIVKAPVYIAGLLFGLFGSRYCMNKLSEEKPLSDDSKKFSEVSEVRANVSEVNSALNIHYMHYGEYPEKLEELVPGSYQKTPLSLCGKPYSYSRNSDQKSFTLIAKGC